MAATADVMLSRMTVRISQTLKRFCVSKNVSFSKTEGVDSFFPTVELTDKILKETAVDRFFLRDARVSFAGTIHLRSFPLAGH